MRVLLLSVFLVACSGCGFFEKKDNEPQDTIQPIEKLRVKAENYKKWTAELEDENGVLLRFKCDLLLFQSLYEISTDGDLDLSVFEGDTGQWFRTPAHDCFYRDDEGNPVDNGSKTTISRDMLLGLFFWIWDRQDLGKAKDLVSFGRNASPEWFMGDGVDIIQRETSTHLRPPLLGTLFEMVHRLGGEDNPIRKYPYIPQASKLNGYQLHLDVLHTFLRGEIFGGISDTELKSLKAAHEKQPKNAFYCAVYHYFKDGNQEHAISMLLDEKFFPSDRLPTSADRCTDYLFQRDYDRNDPEGDWSPCPEREETHPGVDFLWAFKVIDTTK